MGLSPALVSGQSRSRRSGTGHALGSTHLESSESAREYGLKSILNLRGGGPGDWWYGLEIRSAREAGMTYYDLPLSATRRPTRRELLQLIDLHNRCSYPLLIHCKSGADRTGLASAIYRMVRRSERSRERTCIVLDRVRPHPVVRDRTPARTSRGIRRVAQDQAARPCAGSVSGPGSETSTERPDPPADPPPVQPGPARAAHEAPRTATSFNKASTARGPSETQRPRAPSAS